MKIKAYIENSELDGLFDVSHVDVDKKIIHVINGYDRCLPPNPYIEVVDFKDILFIGIVK